MRTNVIPCATRAEMSCSAATLTASPHLRHPFHDRRIIVAFTRPVHPAIHGPLPQRALRRRAGNPTVGTASRHSPRERAPWRLGERCGREPWPECVARRDGRPGPSWPQLATRSRAGPPSARRLPGLRSRRYATRDRHAPPGATERLHGQILQGGRRRGLPYLQRTRGARGVHLGRRFRHGLADRDAWQALAFDWRHGAP